ncbi:MAG: EH signature domain-containing protein [Gammaproteobacteria bacterium]|nr:EH signature domain-containing protein [Gammaproteobacteria bacterium]
MPKLGSSPRQVLEAATCIRRRWPHAESETSDSDTEKLVEEMDLRRKSSDWSDFYWRDATQTALAFAGSDLWERRRFRDLLNLMLDQIGPNGTDGNRAYIRALFRKYLATFQSDSRLTFKLAEKLRSKENWRETGLPIEALVNDWRIFDVKDAPRWIANRMREYKSPFAALRNVGMEAPHGAGLMQETHKIYVNLLKEEMSSGKNKNILRLLDWISPPEHDKSLDKGAELAIDALLEPWHTPPDTTTKKLITARLVASYGDPRLTQAGVWPRCSNAARNVIFRWLIGDTIKAFFKVISEAVESHMWSDRRDLWLCLHEQGRITEGWFALSDAGVHYANRLAREPNNNELQHALRAYARNKSRSSQDRQKCLLIMKVNGRWVVEGSHSFKTHVFPTTGESCVTPYQDSYTCEQFREMSGPGEPERFVHHANWKNRVLGTLMM